MLSLSLRRPSSSGAVVSVLLCSVSAPALAQVAANPPTELPAIVVESGQQSAGKRQKDIPSEQKAPAAAQQSSKPRASQSPSASTGSASPSSKDIASTVGSATGTAVPVEDVAASVTVITSGEIEAQQRRTVPDVLQSVPGINVVQTGGPGGTTSVFMRGTEARHTKMIIDGIEVSNPSSPDGSFDFGQLTAMDIDRIEVLRGPQSGLYGADVVGGVIVAYTKKGEEGPPKFEGFVEGGSFGTVNEAVGVRGASNAVNYAFNVSHLDVEHTPVTPAWYFPAFAPGVPYINNKYENWTYSGKIGVDVSKELSFNFAARYVNSDYAFYENPGDSTRATTHNDQFYARSEAVLKSLGGRVVSYFGVSWTDAKSDNQSVDDGPSSYEGTRIKYDWRSVVGLAPGAILTVGADYKTDSEIGHAISNVDVSESNTGTYVQLQLEPAHNLFLVGNVRYDDNENFGGATTWRFSPAYIIDATGTKLKANVGTAYRAPTLDERFHNYPEFFYFANPDLRPEESTGWDVGFEQPIFANRAQFGATYFHNDITNLITGGVMPDGNFGNINVGKATTEGVEAFISADLTDAWRVRVDYTYTEATNDITRQELTRRPRNKLNVSTGWKPMDRLELNASLLYVGESADNDRLTFDRITLPSYVVVNLASEYELTKNVSAFGRIDNLFDKHYQNPAGYEQPGLGVYGGLKFRN